ncbi:MAG: phosphodiester glycosidase family protein [Clostridia bacterium]|nr:phosphodiester glycosidase family protein [Clostridia bacterium]
MQEKPSQAQGRHAAGSAAQSSRPAAQDAAKRAAQPGQAKHAGSTGAKAVDAAKKPAAKRVASGKPAVKQAAGKPAAKKTSGKRSARKRKAAAKRVAWRAGLSVLTVIGIVLVAALGAGYIGFRGPSQSLGDLLTVSMLETSALKFVPRIYYSAAEVEAIVARNEVAEFEDETDASMIVIAGPTPEPGSADAAPQSTPSPENLVSSEDGIEIYEVHGATYNGWMMIVQDPSRVTCGVCRENFSSKPGLKLHEIAERYNAVAAINGGGFSDSGGLGNGGRPLGLVISNGEVLNKASVNSDHNIVMGFNQDNVLIIGKMTSEEALKKGLRDALAFGPALVINGEAAAVSGSSSGLNPRTAIGQRADGAVLMLVIDGRQASSLGATYADEISVLLEYGAINAANLDGGSSSLMYYKGEYLNKGVLLTGSRELPTGFIVR